jgi:hypothetical protein
MGSWENHLLKKQGLNPLIPTGNSKKIFAAVFTLTTGITTESENLRDYSKEEIKALWTALKGLTKEQIAMACQIDINKVHGAKEQLAGMFYSILYK